MLLLHALALPSVRREALTGVPLILKFITRLGIEQGSSNLYGLTPLSACQVRMGCDGCAFNCVH